MRLASAWTTAWLVFAACGHDAEPIDEQRPAPRAPLIVETPAEDMASIAAGGYRVSELKCLPGEDGTRELGARDYVQAIHSVAAFAIDRHPASCGDYERCVRAGACTELEGSSHSSCLDDLAIVRLGQARAFCSWRGLRLQSYYEWQAAIRGHEGDQRPGGARWQPCPHPDTIAINACPFTAQDGVEYYLENSQGEWTRDTDCTASIRQPLHTAPVAIATEFEQLDLPSLWTQQSLIRCVRDLVTERPPGSASGENHGEHADH